ncbi:MAG: flagellar export chaperone FlgN [bacterium]
MPAKELLIVLEKLRVNLEKLLQNSKDKQKALISMDNQLLTETVGAEEKLVLAIKQIEQQRINTMTLLNRQKKITENEYRLALFIKNFRDELDERTVKLLKSYEKSIKTLSKEIMDHNRENMFLINHSKQFIHQIMGIVYQDKNKSLFDKKV